MNKEQMNTKEIEIKDGDILSHMFEMQRELNGRCITGFDHICKADEGLELTDALRDSKKNIWTLNFIRAVQQELAELTDSVPWKWWAKYQKRDEQNIKVEIVDLFHFLISLALVNNISPEDLYEAYLKKNKINHDRQDSGYKVKDEEDCKDI